MRILGIDVGSSSIKAVEIDSGGRGRYTIHDYYEHPIIAGNDPSQALMRLVQSLPKPPDKIAIAMRTGQVTFRNLKLPTRDKKSIQSSVGFELDDELPFPLEKASYDYSVISQSKQGTQLHVAATLKTSIAGAIASWNEIGIDPDLITTESWAYRTLLSRILGKSEQEEPVLLIQIGNERTTLYIHWNGTPILAREIPWGGRDLTQAIARKYNLSHEQAEQAKLDHGFVVPADQRNEVTHEQMEFSEALQSVLQTLFTEVRQAELICKSITHHNISAAYVAGGTMLLPGLLRVLEESVRIPIKPLQSLSAIATSGVTYSEHTDAAFLLAAAAGLCMVGEARNGAINFRKDEFARGGRQADFNFGMLKGPLTALGAIAACMILSLGFQTASYNRRLTEVDGQLERSMKTFFGTISGGAIHTYLSNTSTLKASVKKELDKQRDLAKLAGPNPKSPLDFLTTVSSAVTKDVITDLMQYQTGAAPATPYSPDAAQTTSLSFLVPNADTASRLEGLLNGKVAGLKREKTEEVTGADGVKQLRVTFSGKPVISGM